MGGVHMNQKTMMVGGRNSESRRLDTITSVIFKCRLKYYSSLRQQ